MSAATAQTLRDFLRRHLPKDHRDVVTIDDRLLGTGTIDSAGIGLLTTFFEETYNIRFEERELSEGGLETLRDIAAVVERRRG